MPFPTTPVLDAFTRADSTTGMGANWAIGINYYNEGNSFYGIATNQAYCVPTTGYVAWYWNVAQFGPDCEAYFTVNVLPTGSADEGVIVYLGMQGIPDGPPATTVDAYQCKFDVVADTWTLYSVVNGAETSIASGSLVLAAGDGVGIQRIGTTIKAWHKPAAGAWTELGSVTNSAVTGAGYIGLYTAPDYGASSPGRLDNFGGGTYVPLGVGVHDSSAALVMRMRRHEMVGY